MGSRNSCRRWLACLTKNPNQMTSDPFKFEIRFTSTSGTPVLELGLALSRRFAVLFNEEDAVCLVVVQ